jgi:hypothetical protein
MLLRTCISFVCLGVAVAASAALAGCDSGGGANGGAPTTHTTTSTASGNPTSGPGPTTGSSMTTTSGGGTGITCPANYCMVGGDMGGYGFTYADGDMPATPTGMSHATLAMNQLCIATGHVMQLPAMPTQADYMNDWGLGIGVNLNQPMGVNMTPGTFTPGGAGITVMTSGVPSCVTTARVVIDNNGVDYCANYTDGMGMIPWSSFNTTCWDNKGMSLSGPPTAKQLKLQFVAVSAQACDFTNFCLTSISL